MAKTTINIEVRRGDDTPEQGHIFFKLAASDALDGIEYSDRAPVRVTLDNDGQGTIQLQPNDDPGWSIEGNSYLVEENFSGKAKRRFYMVVPTSGSALDYADLATYANAPSITANVDLAAEWVAWQATANATYAPILGLAERAVAATIDPTLAVASVPPAPLAIDTYDGGDELVHPSVWYDPNGWNGYRYWMTATPFPAANDQYENPSIWQSHDGVTWTVPAGLTNPIEPTPSGGWHNADNHLFEGPGRTLYCVWNTRNTTLYPSLPARTFVRSSTDGVTWGNKTEILAEDSTTKYHVSPSILWDGSKWRMWAVNSVASPYTVTRFTADEFTGPWTEETCTLASLAGGRAPWHLEVRYFAGMFFMLLQDTTPGGGGSGGRLRFLTSRDGLTWTGGGNELMPSGSAWHNRLYRGTMIPALTDQGHLCFDLWYTGVSVGNAWKVGKSRICFPASRVERARDHAADMNGAANVIAPYVAGDTFNRADGGVGTSTSGHTWTNQAGTANVVSRAGTTSADGVNARATIDGGTADGYFEMTIGAAPAGDAWLVFRLAAAADYFRLGVSTALEGLTLQRVNPGATTLLYGIAPLVAGDRVGVLCSGSTLSLYVNGVMVVEPFTNADNTTATAFGFMTSKSATRIDDVWGRSLVNGA